MDINLITQMYIPIVMVACLAVGYVLSKFIPMDNKWIPLIMLILGAILACIANNDYTLTTIVAGMVTGLASTGFHQLFKQLIESGKVKSYEEATANEIRDDIEVKDSEAK